MNVIFIRPVGFAANSYLLTEDGRTAVAIDPAQPRILSEAEKYGLTVETALLTHGHFDHIGGCAALKRAGARIGCLTEEAALATGNDNMGLEFGHPVPPFSVDFTFSDGEELAFSGIGFRVLATPGHTAGSCCLIVPAARLLFSGDTLFFGDTGRCDLPTGDEKSMKSSLKKLALLPDMKVYPGHGMPTTLGEEKQRGIIGL